MSSSESNSHDWPSIAEIQAMPDDILKQWFWRPIAAVTTEQQALIRLASDRLYHPPATAPVYRFIEPVEKQESETPKSVKKAKPEPAAKTPKPEDDSLLLFKSLFR